MYITLKKILIEIKQHSIMLDLKKSFSLLKPYIFKYRKSYIGLLLFLLIEISLTIGFAWFMGNITDAAVQSDFNRLKWLVLFGIILTIISITTTYYSTFFETIASSAVKKDLRTDLFRHIMLLPLEKTSSHHSGELLSHFTNDINSIDGLIGNSLINLVRLPLITSAAFIYVFHISWQLSLISIVVAPLGIAAGAFFGLLLRKNSRKIYQLYSDMNTLLNESFQGLSVVRSFTLERFLYKKYVKQNKDLYLLELENTKIRGLFYSGSQTVSSIAFLVSICVGTYFVSIKEISVGSLLSFVNLLNYLIYPLTGIAGLWASFQHSITAIERVSTILDHPTESNQLGIYSLPRKLNKSIQLQDVTFKYDEKTDIVKQLTITIPAGKVIALIGQSGAGKTTLFNLLMNLYQPQQGTILIDGVSTDKLPLSELRSMIAYVPQDTFLFDGTIKENLLIARPNVTDSEMINASIDANIHDFVMSLREGYNTEIGERGIKLSGGQKQRISIARALLKNSPILLLDEATSALDSETEHLVKTALDRLIKDRTTIVIAHRLSTIQNADTILVMNQGQIIQQGTHSELLKNKGIYRKMYYTQFQESGKLAIVE
ncbi:ABC transporter ATP-binding protein [Metabacillus halosaccharovorans]|uniref:ABC transporter transmembrane domain-containing protein n=1 Tax=Metabacillus halosaccharovorans TaxID=930124 RepID=UPI00403D6F55